MDKTMASSKRLQGLAKGINTSLETQDIITLGMLLIKAQQEKLTLQDITLICESMGTKPPLRTAVVCAQGDIESLTLLKRFGIDFKSKFGTEELNVLHLAVMAKDKAVLKYLLSNTCVDINDTDKKKRSPLHYAIELGDQSLPLVKLLLKKKANADLSDAEGNAAVHLVLGAMISDPVKKLELLCQYGANLRLRDGNGNSALHILLSRCTDFTMEKKLKILLKYRIEIDAKNHLGQTALDVYQSCEDADGQRRKRVSDLLNKALNKAVKKRSHSLAPNVAPKVAAEDRQRSNSVPARSQSMGVLLQSSSLQRLSASFQKFFSSGRKASWSRPIDDTLPNADERLQMAHKFGAIPSTYDSEEDLDDISHCDIMEESEDEKDEHSDQLDTESRPSDENNNGLGDTSPNQDELAEATRSGDHSDDDQLGSLEENHTLEKLQAELVDENHVDEEQEDIELLTEASKKNLSPGKSIAMDKSSSDNQDFSEESSQANSISSLFDLPDHTCLEKLRRTNLSLIRSTRSEHGGSLLHASVHAGYEKVTDFLVSCHIPVDGQDSLGRTALHVAVEGNSSALVSKLIRMNANPFTLNNERESPFDTAIRLQNKRTLQILLEGSKVTSDLLEEMLLTCMRNNRLLDVIVEHIRKGVQRRNFEMHSILPLAAKKQHWTIVDLLLTRNRKWDPSLNLDKRDSEGLCTAHYCVMGNQLQLLVRLHDCGANMSRRVSSHDHGYGQDVTVLSLARQYGHSEIIDFLNQL